MAALTAEARRSRRNYEAKSIASYVVGTGAVIYQGGLVALNLTTGRAVAATAAASRRFLGLAEETATGDTSGTVSVEVSWGYETLVNALAALTTAYTGANCAISTDNDVTTASGAGTAGVQVLVGEVVQFEGGDAWVALRQYSYEAA